MVPGDKLGLAVETVEMLPINGLRHPPTDTTCGWYIWCGAELSERPDFFSPLHVRHLANYIPGLHAFLSLPPGYRFLFDGKGYQDIWFDESLIAI